jgi:hypothetical protein
MAKPQSKHFEELLKEIKMGKNDYRNIQARSGKEGKDLIKII